MEGWIVIPLGEAKAHLSDLVTRAEAGESIVISRRGVAVAVLGPLQAQETGQGEALDVQRGSDTSAVPVVAEKPVSTVAAGLTVADLARLSWK